MKVKIIRDQLPIIEVSGDIEHFLTPPLVQWVDKLILQGNCYLLFDFSQVTYIDSGGIEVLFNTLKKIPENGRLGIITQNHNIIRILDLVGISKHDSFSLYSTRKEAMRLLERMSKSA